MLFNNGTEQVDCFLNIGIVKLLQFFNKDVEHGDGNLCFLRFIGIDVLIFVSLLLFLLYLTVNQSNLLFNDVLDQNEQTRQDTIKIRTKIFTIDEAQSLPAGEYISLLRISLFELRALKTNQEFYKCLSCKSKHFWTNWCSNDRYSLYYLPLQLFILSTNVFFIAIEGEKQFKSFFKVRLEFFFGYLHSRGHCWEGALLD